MGKLTYIVIHCSDTPPQMKVTREMIESWHKGPRYNPDNTITYMGRTYYANSELPNDYLNGKPIHKLIGRGWDRLGYSDIFHRDGRVENITEYNQDNIIDAKEMTWGAVGVNSISRHIVLVGGWRGNMRTGRFPFFDIFSEAQFLSMDRYLRYNISLHPDIKIIGHYQVPGANKTCPNFDVERFCILLKIPRENRGL